jgi:hypothetical protein
MKAEDSEIRRDRLRSLGKTPTELVDAARYGRISYWRDLLTDSGKPFGEKAARKIEEALALPRGWLDASPNDKPEPAPKPRRASALQARLEGMPPEMRAAFETAIMNVIDALRPTSRNHPPDADRNEWNEAKRRVEQTTAAPIQKHPQVRKRRV